MTGDEFTARYRLREQLNDGDIVSYLAADGHGGTALVHVFRGEFAPAFDPALLDPEGAAALREVLDVEGIKVVVTEKVEAFTTFEAWVAAHQRAAEPVKEGPGAFTRIFRAQVLDGPPAPPPEAGPVSRPTEPASTGEEEAAGDTAAVEPAAPEAAGEAEPEGPGEFTRAFGALSAPADPPPAPAPPPAAPARPAVEPPTPEPPAAAEEAEPEGPGEFTRVFGSLRTPDAPPPAPPPAPPAPTVEVPKAGPPAPPAAPPPAPAPPQPPPAPASPPEHGTGTFTRIMGAMREGQAPPAPPQRPSGFPPPPPPSSPPPPRPGGPPPPRPGDTPRAPGAPPPPYPGAFAPPPRPGSANFPERPVAPPPPPAPPPAPPPGMSGIEPPPPLAPTQPPSPPPGDQGATPGPYTMAMRAYRGSGQSRQTPPPSEPEAKMDDGGYGGSGSYLDRLQSKGRPEDTAAPRPPGGLMPPPAPLGRPGAPPVPSGPSDYTRVIRGAVPPSMGRPGADSPGYAAPPPAPAPAPAKPPPAPSRTPVIIALVATLAVVAALIVFFALRSG